MVDQEKQTSDPIETENLYVDKSDSIAYTSHILQQCKFKGYIESVSWDEIL